MTYEYKDDTGALVLIGDHGDCAHISLGATTCCLISNERQAAAQELAGDGWRVIPADVLHIHAFTADPDEPCAVCGQKVPQWERELLARDPQPDRPEPVDPASVRVGDIVDYETTVEYRLCRIMGEVEDATEHVTGEDGWSLKIHDKWWNCNIATVRILQRPEPEADPEQYRRMHEIWADAEKIVTDPEDGGYHHSDMIREMIRRGVRVVRTDA